MTMIGITHTVAITNTFSHLSQVQSSLCPHRSYSSETKTSPIHTTPTMQHMGQCEDFKVLNASGEAVSYTVETSVILTRAQKSC